MAATVELTLHALIADAIAALDGECDPNQIAEELLADMDEYQMREALRSCLPGHVRDVLRLQLHRASRRTGKANKSSKWDGVAEAAADGRLDDLRDQIFGAYVVVDKTGLRKRLGECGVADVKFAADERFLQSKRMFAQAERFEVLGKLMKRRKAATVAELGNEAVQVLNHA